MSNAGQIALTVVGAVAGAVAGYYTGNYELIGIGASLGNLAGQMAFPTKPNIPTATDARVMGASEGDPIKIVLGTSRIAGTVIWAGAVTENTSSGKGTSGAATATANYFQSFALLLCEGPIIGVRRIWMDKVLVYDKSLEFNTLAEIFANGAMNAANEALDAVMTIYLGDEAQIADPTMEAALGVGNVPAHRGTAYIVFTYFNIANYGPRIPNIECEVVQNGVAASPMFTLYAPGVIAPWVSNNNDPRADSAVVSYIDSNVNIQTGKIFPQYVYSTFDNVVSNGALADALNHMGGQTTYMSWSYSISDEGYPSTTPYLAQINGGAPQIGIPGDALNLAVNYNFYLPPLYNGVGVGGALEGDGSIVSNGSLENYPDNQPAFWVQLDTGPSGVWGFSRAVGPSGTVDVGPPVACGYIGGVLGPGIPDYPAYPTITHLYPVTGGYYLGDYGRPPSCGKAKVYSLVSGADVAISVSRVLQAPPDICSLYPAMPGDPGFCVINNEVSPDSNWALTSGSFMQLSLGITGEVHIPYGNWGGDGGRWLSGSGAIEIVNSWLWHPCGPVIPASDPRNNEAWWVAAYGVAVSAGMAKPGLTYGVDYPQATESAYASVFQPTNITPVPITVGDAVSALCLRCGLTSEQIDVTQLTNQLWGYVVARVVAGRDAITPLQGYGFFDAAVSTTGLLRFIQRGGASVATLTEDNIGAFKGRPQKNSTRLSTPRDPDLELPQTVRIRFANTWNDYQDGMQPAQRLITTSKVIKDIDLTSISMAPNNAAQIADVWLRTTWIGREEPAFTLPADWLGTIQCGDPVTLDVGGVVRRVRIKNTTYSWPGLITVESERDESNAYTSIFVGAITGTSGAPGTSTQSVSIAGPTSLVPMDIPALQSVDNQAGYYAAVYAYLSRWGGATLFRSTDGGTSFTDLVSVTKQATIGTTKNVIGGWKRGWDSRNSITLDLLAGAPPASVSYSTLLNHSNIAAVGADGRWEIIQFQNATLNMDGTYTLNGLIRGLLGTDWAMSEHEAGDYFVLLTGNIVRLNDSISFMGVTEQLKAITSGNTLQTAVAVTQVPREVCLVPLAPICFSAGRNAAGDVIASWVRQDRFANDLVDGTDIPMSETSLLFSIDIYDGADFETVVRTFNDLTIASITYTAAQQTADFGSLQSAVYAEVYQLSAIVGRGYGRQAKL